MSGGHQRVLSSAPTAAAFSRRQPAARGRAAIRLSLRSRRFQPPHRLGTRDSGSRSSGAGAPKRGQPPLGYPAVRAPGMTLGDPPLGQIIGRELAQPSVAGQHRMRFVRILPSVWPRSVAILDSRGTRIGQQLDTLPRLRDSSWPHPTMFEKIATLLWRCPKGKAGRTNWRSAPPIPWIVARWSPALPGAVCVGGAVEANAA